MDMFLCFLRLFVFLAHRHPNTGNDNKNNENVGRSRLLSLFLIFVPDDFLFRVCSSSVDVKTLTFRVCSVPGTTPSIHTGDGNENSTWKFFREMSGFCFGFFPEMLYGAAV